jgi:hypothetical protein
MSICHDFVIYLLSRKWKYSNDIIINDNLFKLEQQ